MLNKTFNSIILLLSILVISCDKDSSTAEFNSANIQVNLLGVDQSEAPIDLLANSSNTLDKNQSNPEFINEQGFDYMADIQLEKIQKLASTTLSKDTLKTNTKYRLIIYDETLTKLIKNEQFSVGTVPALTLPTGSKLKWFAITILRDADININSDGIIPREKLVNNDFCLAQGEITPTLDGVNSINILFKKQNSRYRVELDTRGLFGEIDPQNFSLNIGTVDAENNFVQDLIKFGDFEVISNTPGYKNLTNHSNTFDSKSLAYSGTIGNSFASIYIYSAPLGTLTNKTIAIKINNFKIKHYENNVTRAFNSNIVIPYKKLTNFNITKGIEYRLNTMFAESGIKIGGVTWARTNLYYDPTQTKDFKQYRFRFNNNYTSTPLENEYWVIGSNVPNQTNANNPDPCTLIYPKNTWRIATALDYQNLASISDSDKVFNATSTEWKHNSNDAAIYGTSNLVFNHLGYYNTSMEFSNSTEAQYWAYSFNEAKTESRVFRVFKENSVNKTAISNTDTYPKAERRTIRCVRKEFF